MGDEEVAGSRGNGGGVSFFENAGRSVLRACTASHV